MKKQLYIFLISLIIIPVVYFGTILVKDPLGWYSNPAPVWFDYKTGQRFFNAHNNLYEINTHKHFSDETCMVIGASIIHDLQSRQIKRAFPELNCYNNQVIILI